MHVCRVKSWHMITLRRQSDLGRIACFQVLSAKKWKPWRLLSICGSIYEILIPVGKPIFVRDFPVETAPLHETTVP